MNIKLVFYTFLFLSLSGCNLGGGDNPADRDSSGQAVNTTPPSVVEVVEEDLS